MKKHRSFFAKAKAGIAAHKALTTVIILALLIGGYEIARAKAAQASDVPTYTLTPAHMGNLEQTVSGTGQVTASNQTDIESQVSGTIESIDVSVGQSVKQGELIATVDPTNAQNSLESAKLSLAKLTEAPKETDLSNAQNSVTQAYGDAYNTVSTAYLDLPNIMTGLNNLLYSSDGFLSDQHKTYLSPSARGYRDQAGAAFDSANAEYAVTLQEFKSLDRTSATSSLDQLYADTYKTMEMVSDAANKSQTAVAYIIANEPTYDAKNDTSANTTVNSLVSQANSDTSAILSARNSITSAVNALDNLVAAPDTYDLQSAQAAVDEAQRTYDQYFIRAPYDGVIGRIPVNVYSQAGGSTVIATIVGQQKIATISLNEVDAAKVAVGQPVQITFDAIDGLNATGTVSEVDQVGTVTSGVVSYGVKIAINTQDPRVKPGMSVNTTIITKEEDGVLLVPSSAVKTIGNRSYVQTVPASSTPSLPARTGAQTFIRTTTVTTAARPQNIPVTVGDSDDTNTAIVSGLNPGQLVISGTRSGGTASTAAPSLLQSFGGNRGGVANGGANRGFGGGGAVRIGG